MESSDISLLVSEIIDQIEKNNPYVIKENIRESIIFVRNEITSINKECLDSFKLEITDEDKTLVEKDIHFNTMLVLLKRTFTNIKNSSKLNIVDFLAVVNNNTEKVLDELVYLIDKYFEDTVDVDSLNYTRLQIIGILENSILVTKFVRKYVRYMVASLISKKTGINLEKYFGKANLNFIREGTNDFLKSCSVINKCSNGDIKQILIYIPNVTASKDGAETTMFAKNKLDPTGALNCFLSARFNPFYWIGMKIVDYQNNRYNQAKEESVSLKLEIDYLNSIIANGQGDAALELQLTKAKERLDKVEYKIHKYEEKALNTKY